MSQENKMKKPRVEKVVVHMSVGESGERLRQAEEVLEELTEQKPVRIEAKESNPEFGIREGESIGCKVTLRDEKAIQFLEDALSIIDIDKDQFDDRGNLSFGIQEHTSFEKMEYDPEVGLYGMDITVDISRKGKRVKKRRKESRSIPSSHRVDGEEAAEFIEQEFGYEFR